MVWCDRPWAPAQRPTIRLCKATRLPCLPLFPHLVKFLSNIYHSNYNIYSSYVVLYYIGFNTACKDYVSMNQQSRPSPATTGPGGEQTISHANRDGDERRCIDAKETLLNSFFVQCLLIVFGGPCLTLRKHVGDSSGLEGSFEALVAGLHRFLCSAASMPKRPSSSIKICLGPA